MVHLDHASVDSSNCVFKICQDWRFDVLGTISSPLMDLITTAEKNLDLGDIWKPADTFCVANYLFPFVVTKKELLPGSVELHGWSTRGQVVLDHQNGTTANVMVLEEFDQLLLQQVLVESALVLQTG